MKLDDAMKEAAAFALKLPEGEKLAFSEMPVAPAPATPKGPSPEFLASRKV